jgi:hypothetical protein
MTRAYTIAIALYDDCCTSDVITVPSFDLSPISFIALHIPLNINGLVDCNNQAGPVVGDNSQDLLINSKYAE